MENRRAREFRLEQDRLARIAEAERSRRFIGNPTWPTIANGENSQPGRGR